MFYLLRPLLEQRIKYCFLSFDAFQMLFGNHTGQFGVDHDTSTVFAYNNFFAHTDI